MGIIKKLKNAYKAYKNAQEQEENEKVLHEKQAIYTQVLNKYVEHRSGPWRPPIVLLYCPFCDPSNSTPVFGTNDDIDFINHLVTRHNVTLARAETVYLITYFAGLEKKRANV